MFQVGPSSQMNSHLKIILVILKKKYLYVYQIKPKMIMMPYLNCLNIDAGYYSWVDVVDKKTQWNSTTAIRNAGYACIYDNYILQKL